MAESRLELAGLGNKLLALVRVDAADLQVALAVERQLGDVLHRRDLGRQDLAVVLVLQRARAVLFLDSDG